MSTPLKQLIHMKTRSTSRTITLEELIHDINERIESHGHVLITDHKDPHGYIVVLEGGREVSTPYHHLVEMALALDVPLPDVPSKKSRS